MSRKPETLRAAQHQVIGCCWKGYGDNMKLIDLTGQRFGRLVVVERAESKGKRTMWKCLCDCGNTKVVEAGNLKTGHTTSCGCVWQEVVPETNRNINRRHGMSQTKLHKAWANMRYRCFNPRCKYYDNYGGRGITICDEWNEFESFMEWSLNNGFADGMSLDRIDVNGNYEPGNCRWVSWEVQENNKRNNSYLTLNGQTHTISEWSRITGLKDSTIRERIKRGWTVEDALTKKPIEK